MQLTSNETKLLGNYQNWLKQNKLIDKCSVYFMEQNSTIVLQFWDEEVKEII